MANSTASNGYIKNGASELTKALSSFQSSVIDRFNASVGGEVYTYQKYIATPKDIRQNDEANAVDQQFARYTLEWLGFSIRYYAVEQEIG